MPCVLVPQSPHKDVIYTLTGDATALEYFMVDAVSGYISLKKSLALDPGKRTEYTVSLATTQSHRHIYTKSLHHTIRTSPPHNHATTQSHHHTILPPSYHQAFQHTILTLCNLSTTQSHHTIFPAHNEHYTILPPQNFATTQSYHHTI